MILDEWGRPMTPVFTCYSDNVAGVVISYLGAYGIEAQANSEVPHAILPVRAGKLAKVRVLVVAEDAEQARSLIAEAHEENRLAIEDEPDYEPDEPAFP
jgi:hypothetical protein